MKAEDLKLIVQDKYADITSLSKDQNQSSCCGSTSCCGEMDFTAFSDDYSRLEGYNPDADLGLGCGIPTEFAGIKKGDHLLDLGSGAGNDCFVAAVLTGDAGSVTGLDFTDSMVKKARLNLEKTGLNNIAFVKGDIENMPLQDNRFDVVISNCVLNLVPDKEKAFSEIFRVLKPGGHFCISDVVLAGNLPAELQQSAGMFAGCVSGALQKKEYLEIIKKQGFSDVQIHKEKQILLPDDILLNYMSPEQLQQFKLDGSGIFSITANAAKPLKYE